jgi:hypothetical protein
MTETITGKVIENPDQASTNFFWTYDANGQVFNMQTTVRGVLTFEQVQAHIKTAMEAIAHVQELGGIAKQVGRNAVAEEAGKAATIPTVPSMDDINAALEGTAAAAAGTTTANTNPLTFETEHLVCEIRNDKQYFKIKGGMFRAYGVTVWPEVLTQAGIPVAKLEGKEYSIPGYVAEYVLNDKGKPSKVVKLEKVA